jgi:hypothetical protein
MNPLSFLSQVTVAAVETVKKPVTRVAKQYQPVGADLRIHASGAIFPSDALIAEFGLDYTVRDSDVPAFGFDIIDIADMPGIKSPERFIAISPVPKSAAKVDLFGMTKYDEAGAPLASVAAQGSATFGKEVLLPLLAEVYSAVPNEEGFIDLNILRDIPFTSPNGIFMLPKLVSRGDKKGEVSYIRRENQTVYALIAAIPEELPTGGPDVVAGTDDSDTEHAAILLDSADNEVAGTVSSAEHSETPIFKPVSALPKA